jgi:hypothetical protein
MPARHRVAEARRHRRREIELRAAELRRQRQLADPDTLWREHEIQRLGCHAFGLRHCGEARCCYCGRWDDDTVYDLILRVLEEDERVMSRAWARWERRHA